MSLLIWGLAFFLLGIVAYIAVPILIGPWLPLPYRSRLGKMYFGHAVAAARRPILLERAHGGGHTLIACDFDPKLGNEAPADGKKMHFRDAVGLMGRMAGYPMGLASGYFDVVTDAMHAEFGKVNALRRERGEETLEVPTKMKERDDGEMIITEVESCANYHARLDASEKGISLHDIHGLLGDSAAPTLGETGYDHGEKSQSAFNSPNYIEAMALIMAYMAGAGVVWFITTQGGSISNSVRGVQLMAGGLPI